jgi:hypothetical protein
MDYLWLSRAPLRAWAWAELAREQGEEQPARLARLVQHVIEAETSEKDMEHAHAFLRAYREKMLLFDPISKNWSPRYANTVW